MNKLESKDRKLSNTWLIVVVGMVLALIGVIINIPFKITSDRLNNWSTLFVFVAMVGVLFNIKWENFNKSLTKNAIIWGIIFIGFQFLPLFNAIFVNILKNLR